MELTAAIGKDWADVLEGLPQEALEAACRKYLRNEPRRKPTPGAIYELAREAIPRPRVVPDTRPSTPEEDAAYLESVSRDKINPDRKAEAEAILAAAWPSKRGESA